MQPFSQPLSRRRILQTGSLLSVGLGLSQVMRLRAASAGDSVVKRDDTAVILVWLTGGLSHMATYDLKPQAPLEYRGEFAPIQFENCFRGAADVMDAVYKAIPKSKKNIREDDKAVLFQFEHTDGFRGAQFMLPSAGMTGVAVKLKGQKPLATGFEERVEPRYPHAPHPTCSPYHRRREDEPTPFGQ